MQFPVAANLNLSDQYIPGPKTRIIRNQRVDKTDLALIIPDTGNRQRLNALPIAMAMQ